METLSTLGQTLKQNFQETVKQSTQTAQEVTNIGQKLNKYIEYNSLENLSETAVYSGLGLNISSNLSTMVTKNPLATNIFKGTGIIGLGLFAVGAIGVLTSYFQKQELA